ncbi:MAG: hypothetical protein V3U50_04600, partial [Acidimicrobiia bacterium]
YLSNQEYPPATEALAVKAAELAGITLDMGDLALETRQFLSTVNEALEGNDELQKYVERLEEDADVDIEHNEHLMEEIEDFLREQS